MPEEPVQKSTQLNTDTEQLLMSPFNRIVLIVLDGAGIGAMPDAPEWGDAGSDTFGHILESRKLHLPNLQRYGLREYPTAQRSPAT